jgi:hypothetical protein
MIDATDLLFRYARRVALSVADRWSPSAGVIKFLETGDLALASTIESINWIVNRDGRKAGATHVEETNAKRAAQLVALGALEAHDKCGERANNSAVGVFGLAIYFTNRSARNPNAARQFNDFILKELAIALN